MIFTIESKSSEYTKKIGEEFAKFLDVYKRQGLGLWEVSKTYKLTFFII